MLRLQCCDQVDGDLVFVHVMEVVHAVDLGSGLNVLWEILRYLLTDETARRRVASRVRRTPLLGEASRLDLQVLHTLQNTGAVNIIDLRLDTFIRRGHECCSLHRCI